MNHPPPQGDLDGLYEADVIESDTTYSDDARLLWCSRTDDTDIEVTLAEEIEANGRIIDVEAATAGGFIQVLTEGTSEFILRDGSDQNSIFVNAQERQRVVFFDGDWYTKQAGG